MKPIRNIFIFMLLSACVGTAQAQGIASFRAELERRDALFGSSVRVVEHGSAADAVARVRPEANKTVQGYRIRIFFANNQTARQDAMAVQESFRHQFPQVPSYLVYDNPAFIVTVGNCLTLEEALILQHKLKGRFDTAFLWRGEIPLGEFVKQIEPPIEAEEETDADPGLIREG